MSTQKKAIQEAIRLLENGNRTWEALTILKEALKIPEDKERKVPRLLQKEDND